MRLRPKVPGFRLLDGVVLGAVALLAVKVLGIVAPPAPAADPPAFGRVFTHARTNYVPPDPATTGSVTPSGSDAKPAAPPSAAAAGEPKPLPTPSSPTEKVLMERLGERRDLVDQRSREVELREKLLEEQEKRMEERLGELRADEERRSGGRAGAPDEPGLKNLVTMYEAMKPKEAARVFDRLPHDILVSVVVGMNPRKMSEVLAAMAPETAEKLTVALAKRARAGGEGAGAATAAASLPAGELPAIDPPRR